MPPEILRVGFFMDFLKSAGFSMVVFLWCFLCKSDCHYPVVNQKFPT